MVVPVAILVGGVLVAVAVYATTRQRVQNTASGSGNPSAVLPITVSDHILGNPDAPVKIIEYADFECQYCAQFQQTLHRIINDYGPAGQVAWVFREFPLIEIHPSAMKDAEAAECVAQTAGNAAFWKFADILFAHQPVDSAHIGQYAQEAGADPSAVASCIVSGSIDARITADRANAFAVGAGGAPYALIVVNGAPPLVVNGAYSYNYVKQQIDAALTIASSTQTQP